MGIEVRTVMAVIERFMLLSKIRFKGTAWYVRSLFVFGATAPVGQGLLIHEVSRSPTTTHYSW